MLDHAVWAYNRRSHQWEPEVPVPGRPVHARVVRLYDGRYAAIVYRGHSDSTPIAYGTRRAARRAIRQAPPCLPWDIPGDYDQYYRPWYRTDAGSYWAHRAAAIHGSRS